MIKKEEKGLARRPKSNTTKQEEKSIIKNLSHDREMDFMAGQCKHDEICILKRIQMLKTSNNTFYHLMGTCHILNVKKQKHY